MRLSMRCRAERTPWHRSPAIDSCAKQTAHAPAVAAHGLRSASAYIATLAPFRPPFGCGQQYLSFVRTPAAASAPRS
jgi:hypothetical protein